MTAQEKIIRWSKLYKKVKWNKTKTAFIGYTEYGTKDFCYVSSKTGHPTIYQA